MSEAISEIVRFQEERNLHLKGYDALNENVNIMEELLESIGLNVKRESRPNLKISLMEFVEELIDEGIAKKIYKTALLTPIENRVDAYCDIIVFAIGVLIKLGYNPELALQECAKEINSRVGTMIDGKFEKDLSEEAKKNWYKANYSVAKLSDCNEKR